MRFLIVLFLFIGASQLYGQQKLVQLYSPTTFTGDSWKNASFPEVKEPALGLPQDLKFYAIASYGGDFHRTYLVNTDGESVDAGFMPSTLFRANSNPIVFTGHERVQRDSFNPYGASDLAGLLFFGTVNNFITKFRLKKQ